MVNPIPKRSPETHLGGALSDFPVAKCLDLWETAGFISFDFLFVVVFI